jgi:hypothetical protein
MDDTDLAPTKEGLDPVATQFGAGQLLDIHSDLPLNHEGVDSVQVLLDSYENQYIRKQGEFATKM